MDNSYSDSRNKISSLLIEKKKILIRSQQIFWEENSEAVTMDLYILSIGRNNLDRLEAEKQATCWPPYELNIFSFLTSFAADFTTSQGVLLEISLEERGLVVG